ncbi:pitrilysin family protein [Rhabdobacter roseus]|uniref:Putative Zn-dependent peptidase n=1 Tax=Rhabdobacter roseus TaxID=1655419 RepID=A0A840TQI4_9BACT|nr:pitrilysin family protein [Rhabdobacter roseus]MBB5282009.1 putative Zn-dependent peptidase [Rhabdobacter roseus]
MQLDRTIAPPYRIIQTIHFPDFNTIYLDNGLPLHVINIGEQPVVRLECIFEAGTWFEKQPGASYFAIKMLTEGTSATTSVGISAAFDRVGAFTDLSHSPDRVGIVVYCLARFLPEVLPLVQELIATASFPDKEWEDLRNITLQNLRVNQQKNSFLATVQLRASLFGKEHPYGRSQSEERITNLKKEEAQAHYAQYMQRNGYRIVLSGQVGEAEIQVVNKYLGQAVDLTLDQSEAVPPAFPAAIEPALVEKPESLQSSIRYGKRLFTRKHPDYYQLLVANELLGGYFGSRLMKNIREEKGLTYGISSSVVTYRHEGYFTIGTDVKKEFTQQTLDEIRKEIQILQTEPVGAEELQNVKNFMAGEFAGSLNTAFDIADRQKILLLEGLPADFFEQYVRQIHATSPEDILRMFNTYLQPDDMTEVVVGGK